MENNGKAAVSMAAINPQREVNICSPDESRKSGKDMIQWGDRNYYPHYLLGLYDNVPTLRSIINGNVDFTGGDDCRILPLNGMDAGVLNLHGDTAPEMVRWIARDYWMYGGFALQIIRNRIGDIAEIYYIDMRYIRSNKENTVFYYSEKFEKGGSVDALQYPAFLPELKDKWLTLSEEERNRHASSIFFVKNSRTRVYPSPVYAAAVKDCEIERCVTDYHLNAVNNCFEPSAIVSFHNGIPTDEIKDQVEQDMRDKFTGHENAARLVLSWNPNKENETTFDFPKVEDFGERYKALESHCRQQIFTSFRAMPLLFGLQSEANTGFSTDEFEQSFRLYNRTQIRPAQRIICDAFDKIYGAKGVLTIRPFSLDEQTEQIVK